MLYPYKFDKGRGPPLLLSSLYTSGISNPTSFIMYSYMLLIITVISPFSVYTTLLYNLQLVLPYITIVTTPFWVHHVLPYITLYYHTSSITTSTTLSIHSMLAVPSKSHSALC